MQPHLQSPEDDFDRGVRNRRAVLGDAWVDQSLDNTTEFNADFQSLVTRWIEGQVLLSRKGFAIAEP